MENQNKEFLHIAVQAAKKAGAYQKEKWQTNFKVEFKSDINLVTEVDKHCEKEIVSLLQEHFPDHDIMAEEGTGNGTRKDSPYKWIIDPLDGTTNFAHRYPLFAVSIALEHQGEIIIGIVYDPLKDELFTAIKGEGAFLNEQKISVSDAPEVNKALVATGFAYNIREAKDYAVENFVNMLMSAQGIRRDGVAAIDLCYVACGRYDAFFELNLFPWDVAAGKLILEEAGGKVTLFSGKEFSVYDKEILATNGKLQAEMGKILKY